MFINQLSVFIENRTGRLDEVLEALKEADINIISLSLADTSDYGLLRMIVSEPEKAKEETIKEAIAIADSEELSEETLAVITAALMAYYEMNNPKCEFTIKRIKRLNRI